jgi:hypothetical protein
MGTGLFESSSTLVEFDFVAVEDFCVDAEVWVGDASDLWEKNGDLVSLEVEIFVTPPEANAGGLIKG